MAKKRAILLFTLCFFNVSLFAAIVKADPVRPEVKTQDNTIPKEPGWKDPSYRGWEVMSIPGLISTYYDLDLDGNLDYMVIRKILRKASSEEVSIEQAIVIAKHDEMSVYFSNPVIYFAHRHPLFYCKGVDFRKNCRDIWVDIAEDGLNGNEQLYTLSTPLPNVR